MPHTPRRGCVGGTKPCFLREGCSGKTADEKQSDIFIGISSKNNIEIFLQTVLFHFPDADIPWLMTSSGTAREYIPNRFPCSPMFQSKKKRYYIGQYYFLHQENYMENISVACHSHLHISNITDAREFKKGNRCTMHTRSCSINGSATQAIDDRKAGKNHRQYLLDSLDYSLCDHFEIDRLHN